MRIATARSFQSLRNRAGYDIGIIMDNAPTGYTRIEAAPTSKNDARSAIVLRRPVTDFPIDNVHASPALVSLQAASPWIRPKLQRSKLTLHIPERPAASWPAGEAYACKIAGAR